MSQSEFRLSREEILLFHEQGYLGPFTAISPDEMRQVNRYLHDEVFKTDGPNPTNKTHSRHLDTPEVYDLVAHPAVVHRVASILGEDLQCWTSGFFVKEPRVGKATEWHQDINYWPLEPAVNITCWMAFDDVNEENAPMRIIPGSHKLLVPHRPSGETLRQEAEPQYVDESKALTMCMRAGQFIIFSEKLLHSAPPNTSNRSRTAMATRYTMGITKVYQDQPPIAFPAHRVLFVSGTDHLGLNKVGQPPRHRPVTV